jgi:hypothetical protein
MNCYVIELNFSHNEILSLCLENGTILQATVFDSDPDPEPRVTDPDLTKSFGSMRIRIHNTAIKFAVSSFPSSGKKTTKSETETDSENHR